MQESAILQSSKNRRFLSSGLALLAGLIFNGLSTESIRLDVQSDAPDAVPAKLIDLRLDLGGQTRLLRIGRLCIEQTLLVRRCFQGSELPPYIQLAHDAVLTPDGPDLIVVSKSDHAYIAFQPTLTGYFGARLASFAVVSAGVFLLCSFPGAAGWAACALLLFWCDSNWLDLIRLTRQNFSAAPITDYWRVIAYFPRYLRFDISTFWKQHNEHRIVFPEIAMAADALLLHGRALLPLVLEFFFQFVTLGLYSFLIWRETNLSRKLRCFAIVLACGLAGWPGMAIFVSHPFLSVWLFTQVAVVLALAALPRSLPLAIAGGVIATYSTGNGMLIWPVLILAAFALRFPPRRILILFASGTLFTALYFAGYYPTELNPKLLFLEPLTALEWMAAYLSLPFGFAGAQAGLINGFGGLILLAAVIVFDRHRRPASLLFQGAAIFVVASALLAAPARMALGHMTPASDFDPRFLSLPLFFWISLLFALVHLKWNWPIATAAAGLIVLQLAGLSPWMERQLLISRKDQVAAFALEAGTLDGPLIQSALYYDLDTVVNCSPIMHKYRLSVFSSGRFDWLGKPAPLTVDPKAAQGEILNTRLIGGGIELSGWTTGSSRDIVFVNEKGLVLGFGGRVGPGWTGFANLEFPGKSLRAFRVEGGRMAAIGAPVSLPDAVPVPYYLMGQRMTTVKWKPDAAWTEAAVSPQLADTPFGLRLGTYRPKHAQGKLLSDPFPAPPGNCMILPASHGSSVTGETVQVLDGETQKPIATLPLGPADGAAWRLWRVPIPAASRTLIIRAEDLAAGEGQWLGLGEPARCTSSYQ